MRTLLLVSLGLLVGMTVSCSRPPVPKTGEGSASAGASRNGAERAARNGALTARVKAALAGDVALQALKIDVDSSDGVVTLRGPVDTQETSRRAQEVGQAVEGVRLLQNQLVVRDGTG